MKRLAFFLAGMLVAAPLFAAARTASVDGPYNSTATWGGAAVPTLADACTINAGIEVLCDTNPCQCGSWVINGSLLDMDSGQTVKSGNFTAVAGDGKITIAAAGSLVMGPGTTLEFNCDRSAAGTTDMCILTNNGALTLEGKRVATGGVITAVGAVDSASPRVQLLTVSGMQQPIADYFSGRYLRVLTGYFRGHVFEITTGAGTDQIAILPDSRGGLDTRHTANNVNPTTWTPGDWGAIRSTGTAAVAINTTTITFNTAFSSTGVMEEQILGSRFVCNADIGAAGDFTNFRRICSVTDTTHAELCTTYPTGNCNPTAAYRIYDDNQPPKHVIINEAFKVGDTFEIWRPAISTITVGNRSNANSNAQYNWVIADGSNTYLDGVLIDYCGRDDNAGYSAQCIDVTGIDNGSTSEQFHIQNFDIWHFSGEDAIKCNQCTAISFLDGVIHDAAEGGRNDGHEAHGIYLAPTADADDHNMEIGRVRCKSVNDDCFVVSGSPPSGAICTDCDFHDNWCGMVPGNLGDSSSESCLAFTNSVVRTKVRGNFITNIDGLPFGMDPIDIAPDSVNATAISGNLILNTQRANQSIHLGQYALGFRIPDSLHKPYVVGNAIIGAAEAGSRGYWLDNLIVPLNPTSGNTEAALQYPQGVKGNVFVAPPPLAATAAQFIVHPPSDSTEAACSPLQVVISDNAVVGNATVPASGSWGVLGRFFAQALGSDLQHYLWNHNTVFCRESAGGGGDSYAIHETPANTASAINNATNNIFVDCRQGIREEVTGSAGDTTSSYNLYMRNLTDVVNVTQGSNELTTASGTSYRLSFKEWSTGNLSAAAGSVAWTSLGSDGYPRGVRVAGPPNTAQLASLYPFPLVADTTGLAVITAASQTTTIPIVNANTIGDVDTDGDGVWNLFDNCDLTWNANQYDGDSNGKGCVCDAAENGGNPASCL